MKRMTKVALFSAFFFLLVHLGLRYITEDWINLNTVLLVAAGAMVGLAAFSERALLTDFLTMRTTKHGMNMGAMIVMVVTVLVCVNYLANRHNKTWDVTKERLNSLSEQSEKLLKNLKDDMAVKVFYRGPKAAEERQRVKQNLTLFQAHSGKLKPVFINSYSDVSALEYLKDQPDKEAANVIVFVEYGGKKVRVDPPYEEAQMTSAMIKATRTGESKIYFITGHGEKDPELDDEQGLKEFSRALSEASFQVQTLNLVDKKEIPKDAAVVAIVGPQVAYLEAELGWIRDYINAGGKLFLALDPGQRHGLANLTKPMGVQFANNYVFTNVTIEGGGPATVLGRFFDPGSEITRSFPSGRSLAIFPLVSEITPAQGRDERIQVNELVKSDASSFTVTDPTQKLQQMPKTSPITVGIHVKGPVPGAAEPAADGAGKTFEAVIFGDSDFIANRGIMFGINRDLALNAIAQLADQKDLISIKPKMPAGMSLTLTGYQRFFLIVLGFSLPLALLVMSGVLWFRRRGA
jgi:ABC-type uncharacterized transport system involved in gliding motility auxiliary subunit